MKKIKVEVTKSVFLYQAFPVALVTVEENITPVAMNHVFSFNPPIIGIGIENDSYTCSLLKKKRAFGINFVDTKLIKEVKFCGTTSGRKHNKFQEAGLHSFQKKTGCNFIEESPVNIGCKVMQNFVLGDHTWFIGEVKEAYIDSRENTEPYLYFWNSFFTTLGEKWPF